VDFDEAVDHLDRLINYEVTPRAGRVEGLSVEPMRNLVASMGDPQLSYPAIHVTGTNGKGSTVRMISTLLQTMGLQVGTYLSPHLRDVTERILVAGEQIGEDDFGSVIGAAARAGDQLDRSLTWFETVTAAALHHFADVAVDVAVVEVGMLGRFDATNVVDGKVAVVTNVGRDHTDGQGDWRRQIAAEKAGIIKPGSTLVLGETDPGLRPVFAAEAQAETLVRGVDFDASADQVAVGGRLVDLYTSRARYDDVFMSLHGAHQADNAAVAVAAAEAFFASALPDDVVRESLGSMAVPGRFEILGGAPLVVVDGAHNPDGARAAAETLKHDFSPTGSRIYVIGMQDGRDPVTVMEALDVASVDLVIACAAPTARGIPAEDIGAAADKLGAPVEIVPDVGDAVRRALDLADDNSVIGVFGSFTVLGAAADVVAQVRLLD
jgi:dihydrofolate synthase/folylpolyglutamate synthase